jgi:hypothetical protein
MIEENCRLTAIARETLSLNVFLSPLCSPINSLCAAPEANFPFKALQTTPFKSICTRKCTQNASLSQSSRRLALMVDSIDSLSDRLNQLPIQLSSGCLKSFLIFKEFRLDTLCIETIFHESLTTPKHVAFETEVDTHLTLGKSTRHVRRENNSDDSTLRLKINFCFENKIRAVELWFYAGFRMIYAEQS